RRDGYRDWVDGACDRSAATFFRDGCAARLVSDPENAQCLRPSDRSNRGTDDCDPDSAFKVNRADLIRTRRVHGGRHEPRGEHPGSLSPASAVRDGGDVVCSPSLLASEEPNPPVGGGYHFAIERRAQPCIDAVDG